MTDSEIEDLYRRIKPHIKKESTVPYARWSAKVSDTTITAYNSGKVLFQGNDLSWLEDESPAKSASGAKKASKSVSALQDQVPSAGSDEVGTGDYFGPLTVASVLVETLEQAEALKKMGITDSKQLKDSFIRKAAPKIKELVPFSVQVLDPIHYNSTWRKPDRNLNWIKTMMHNQAYLNLKAKGYNLPKLMVVDQFCVPSSFRKYVRDAKEIVEGLHFETKAESKYIAVAAASVLARNAFLEYWDKMEEKYDFHFEKGGGAAVDACAARFVEEHGWQEMSSVANMHFANTDKVKNKLKD